MKKTIVSIVTSFVLALVIFQLPTADKAEAQSAYSNQEAKIVSAVNFRTAPSTNSRVLGTLSRGTTVEVVDKVNSHWLKVKTQGREGYISAEPRFVELGSVQKKATIVSAVNFRTAPSTNSRVLGTLSRGTSVEVLEVVNNHWLKVSAFNRVGYISSQSRYVDFGHTGNGSSGSDSGQSSNDQSQSSAVADRIIQRGLKYRGTPYVFGARAGQTSTFDCSSFVQYVFHVNGISLPRNSRQQATVGQTIMDKNQLQKGDLIFFKTGYRSDGKIDHVAIYAGNGKILHSIPNGGVQVANLSSYWLDKAVGAKRVIR